MSSMNKRGDFSTRKKDKTVTWDEVGREAVEPFSKVIRAPIFVFWDLAVWILSSMVTIFLTMLLIAISSGAGKTLSNTKTQYGCLFLHSYFAHAALCYIISRNITNVAAHKCFAQGWYHRPSQTHWQDRKKRVVLTTVFIVNECFILSLIPSSFLNSCHP